MIHQRRRRTGCAVTRLSYAPEVSGVRIEPVRYDAPVAQLLVAEAMAELARRYGGGGDETPVAVSDFDPPGGAFLVAYLVGEPAGCVGWRSFGGTTVAELKRMYTRPAARGRGVARALLAAVEESARAYGRARMILECGDRQPEAVSLYLSHGYEKIEDFGHYRDEPGVISLGRALTPPILA